MIKKLYDKFRTWDKERKFGHTFGDFLILGSGTLIIGSLIMLRVKAPLSYILIVGLMFVNTALVNRQSPEI